MNDVEITRLIDILLAALRSMSGGEGPARLERRLRFELEERQVTADVDGAVRYILNEIVGGMPNSPAHAMFAQHIRRWDALSEAGWTSNTKHFTPERRALVYRRLDLSPEAAVEISARIPIHKGFDDAILVATEHEEWYTEPRKQTSGTFYWDRYAQYLEEKAGWDEDATTSLNESTDKVIKCLSDPQRQDAFPVRGLVVGYVQSGKTANFTAVIAKAIDAGYRLVIVLAGVLDSLRFQTQRRLDKELVGVEQIRRDKEEGKPHEYSGDHDWDRFTSYGCLPSEQGSFDLRRITTSVSDYQKLGQGRDVLRFEKAFPDRPANHPDNLRTAAARIVVIKKHPAVIKKLVADLKGLQMSFDDIPALIIDDESDQASVNTINPRSKSQDSKAEKRRTSTNKAIVDLLALLPRSQYIGYTATPAANTLINPNDAQDLFPRDFIELLPRPENYMGVSDFHDFDADFNPLSEEEIAERGHRSNKNAYVRTIDASDDTEIFRTALDAFFLTGAIKLYRADLDKKAVNVRHHTMLVHRATSQRAHDEDRDTVRVLLANNGYRKTASLDRLWRLWLKDFEPVSKAKQSMLARPGSLSELKPFLEGAIDRFYSAKDQVLVVNGDDSHKDEMPDFDKENVWNILVGGAKLSRGYTVEGLTISYFLRKASAADSLMQMGRWFGFRRGYRDLVRLYIGTQVSAGKKQVDLYNLFESICMDEERFRRRIAVYSREGIKPIQVPPLVPMGMLVPTQKNKMYNAEIAMENFGGRGAESGRVPFKPKEREWNVDQLRSLLGDRTGEAVALSGLIDASSPRVTLRGRAYEASASEFLAFLKSYKWGTQEGQFNSVIGFLSGSGKDDPEVNRWRIVLMDNPSSTGKWTFQRSTYGVFRRGSSGERFNVFSEPRHKAIAKHLTEEKLLLEPNQQLEQMTQPHQGVCLIYPTVQTDFNESTVSDEKVTLGLSLEFPSNKIPQTINWRVRDPNSPSAFIDAK